MKPPYDTMQTATLLTYATIPCRLLKLPVALWVLFV